MGETACEREKNMNFDLEGLTVRCREDIEETMEDRSDWAVVKSLGEWIGHRKRMLSAYRIIQERVERGVRKYC